MKKLKIAIIGMGRLGIACAEALLAEEEITLAGMVRRPESVSSLPGQLQRFPVAGHIRDLPAVDAALVCVPADSVLGVARELLQARVSLVECAILEGRALDAHYAELDNAARNHRATAVVGAGWNPGVLPLFAKAFEILIPHGHAVSHHHPGIRLHHSAAVAHVPGVKCALAGEFRGADAILRRYVYVELKTGADIGQVRAAIADDPLFADEETQVFQVDRLAELEAEEGQGMVLERRSGASQAPHASLLLEARFDLASFAARVMLDAARQLPTLSHGAHRYTFGI